MSKLQVAIVERGLLADVLRGIGSPRAKATELRDGRLTTKLRSPCVGVGYVDGHLDPLPHFLVIPGSDRREFFAWVNTYCPFVTPLSQWCRVVTEEELVRIQSLEIVPQYGNAASAWAGATVGEAFLHVGTGLHLSQLSVTALKACASFVAARAFGLWGTRGTCSASVQQYEDARRVLGANDRGTNMKDYQQLWTVLETLSGKTSNRMSNMPRHHMLTIRSCEDIQKTGFVSESTILNVVEELGWQREFVQFERIGAEQRVQLFDNAVSHLMNKELNIASESRALAEFIVSYFAARIGGNTSKRIQLVEKLLDRFPMLALWYGVASALHRPEIWGAEFDGLGRLALRELAFPLRFDDPPRCDIAFDELVTLVAPGAEPQSLGFRGATRNALNIEVSMGVSGVIRLSMSPDRGAVVGNPEAIQSEVPELLRHLKEATDHASRLAEMFGAPISGGASEDRPKPRQTKKKRSRSRKSGRSDSDKNRQLSFASPR